jgi:hypothetical protein
MSTSLLYSSISEISSLSVRSLRITNNGSNCFEISDSVSSLLSSSLYVILPITQDDSILSTASETSLLRHTYFKTPLNSSHLPHISEDGGWPIVDPEEFPFVSLLLCTDLWGRNCSFIGIKMSFLKNKCLFVDVIPSFASVAYDVITEKLTWDSMDGLVFIRTRWSWYVVSSRLFQ